MVESPWLPCSRVARPISFISFPTTGYIWCREVNWCSVYHNVTQCLPCTSHFRSSLHYAQLVRKQGHYHVPGNSPTGKTSALLCALSLFGCQRDTFYSRGSNEAYLYKYCTSTLPVGCDDLQSQLATGQLIVELSMEPNPHWWNMEPDTNHQHHHICKFQFVWNSQVRQ